jgi:hypothetical protein
MPNDQDASKTLTRLKKLGHQLDRAKQASQETVKDVTRAKATSDGITRDVRVFDTSTMAKPSGHRPRSGTTTTGKRGAKRDR